MQSTYLSNNQPNRPSLKGRLIRGLVAWLVTLLISFLLYTYFQQILDFVKYVQYTPNSTIAATVKRADMSDNGKFIFYATHPVVEDSSQFNQNCERKEENIAVLGCYTNDRIYIYNVTDARLDGIREVTAAHEMLHAAYQRLSKDERDRVDTLVEAEYTKLSAKPEFADRMEFYARTEPGERDNELHSIIGTEVVDIDPVLEKHYSQYFAKRSKVVDLYNGYNATFVEIDRQAKELSSQLDALAAKLDSDMARYKADIAELEKKITVFNEKATTGGFTSPAAFNSERRVLQQQVDEITNMRERINSDAQQYEKLRQQYNQTITTSSDLYKSIDSTPEPAPQI